MTTDAAWAEEMVAKFGDASIRLASLYKIVTKGESPEDGLVVTFRPNLAQRRFLRRLWSRNIILKARQLGFSTLACILWLDTALFSADPIACGIVAQDKDAAEKLFRKVTFAYDNLPVELRQHAALAKRTESEIVFAHNGASIRVATSMRSGTIHRLHVSEFGKIGAKYPMKAKEVITGSIPAVPMESGIVIIESTAEGASGRFYDMSMAAKKLMDTPGHVLNPREYRMHFYPWWQEPGYTLPADAVRLDETDAAYFAKIEGELGRRLAPEQKAWYVATLRADFAGERPLMWQEYPSCVDGDTMVSTVDGMIAIRELVPDGKSITKHFVQGVKPTFEVVTKLGYRLVCTDDHPIKLADGRFMSLADGLTVGGRIAMGRPSLGRVEQSVEWSPVLFSRGEIRIDADFAEFLGLFMGDGSFHSGVVSIACDAQDEDVIRAAETMFDRYLGGATARVTGEKKGCVEIRKASNGFIAPFLALGVVERRAHGGHKRRVHVPPYIFRSPPHVAAAFLRGLIEADGFAARDGTSIKFFSKHGHVVRDVQLLLLAFGIESRVTRQVKQSRGYEYVGWELALRADGVRKFAKEIGFISRRKQDRANLSLTKRATGSPSRFDWTAEIVSIEPAGDRDVYDITTATHEFTAGGIVVHNCINEPFKVSTDGVYFAKQLTMARQQGRIGALPIETGVPVNSFWDLGVNDNMAIWLHQRVGLQNRFIGFKKESGEPLSHFSRWLIEWANTHGATFGAHFLPHDAGVKRMGLHPDLNQSVEDMLRELMPGHRFEIVPRVTSVLAGIQATREAFASAWIDEDRCAEGLADLSIYRKQWDDKRGTWKDAPFHGPESDSADAFRQWGQVVAAGGQFAASVAKPVSSGGSRWRAKRRGSGMAV